MGLHSVLQRYLYFVYVDDVRTSQETPLGSNSLLTRIFFFVYVDGVRTSQETRLWASATCCWDSFIMLTVVRHESVGYNCEVCGDGDRG
jgi:hypothetical protein